MIYNILEWKGFEWNFKNYEDLIIFYRSFSKDFYSKNYIYTETHHILPKCMGGDNTKDNLIELPWMIHVLAHFLLAKKLEKTDKQFSQKNYYAVRMILNQDRVENVEELRKLAEISAIELETKNKLNCKKIFIKKEGEKTIQIFEDDLTEYEKLGWEKGRNFKDPSGRVFVNDGVKSYLIPKNEINSYLEKGFQKGMFKTTAMKEFNHSHTGESSTKGWKWVHKKGEESLLVKPCEVEDYLKNGWSLGTNRQPMLGKKNPHSKESLEKLSNALKGKPKSLECRQKISKSLLGKKWYNNGIREIHSETCPDGFKKGRLKNEN